MSNVSISFFKSLKTHKYKAALFDVIIMYT